MRVALNLIANKASVDRSQCQRLGELIKNTKIPLAQEEPIHYKIPERVMSNLYFAIVAICHQTTPHNAPPLKGSVDGKLRHGWDYLREKLIKATEQNPSFVSAESLSKITREEIESILFDETFGSTIIDSKGRASLLNDIGQKLKELNIDDIQSLYEQSQGYLAGENGLIKLLSNFQAFNSDPVQKKLFFFLALMYNQGLWKYKDPENLGTPVDYHEVRGHLRYKTVRINSEELEKKLINGEEVSQEDDIEIRKAVFDAIMLVSQISGRTPNDLHYFFWNIFRNCCKRDETHCNEHPGGKHTSLPERYEKLSPEKCIFSDTCESSGKEVKLRDHVVNTELY